MHTQRAMHTIESAGRFFLHQTEFFFVMMMSQVVIALAIFFIQITHTARQCRGPQIVKKINLLKR